VAEIWPQIEFDTTPLGGGILLPVWILTRVFLRCDRTKFQPNVAQTGHFTQWLTHSCLCLSQLAKCRFRNTQNDRTVLPIANLTADPESGSPDSYSSFLVPMGVPRLVSEIFVCDRQTDGRTNNVDHYYSWPHTVAGQLITETSTRWLWLFAQLPWCLF